MLEPDGRSREMFPGAVTLGRPVSLTVRLAVALSLLPAASVALKVTVVTPSGNGSGALLLTARLPSTSSLAEAAFRKATI